MLFDDEDHEKVRLVLVKMTLPGTGGSGIPGETKKCSLQCEGYL